MNETPAPLILTLGFDARAFEVFEDLRLTHFPAALNHIPAHLTLFHHLPGKRETEIAAEIARHAAATPVFAVQVAGLRKLGRGTAFEIISPELTRLRAALAAVFAADLTPQDRQGFRPHVTIQNKVPPSAANALHERLSLTFEPWSAPVEALLLWRYLGGPWRAAGHYRFAA